MFREMLGVSKDAFNIVSYPIRMLRRDLELYWEEGAQRDDGYGKRYDTVRRITMRQFLPTYLKSWPKEPPYLHAKCKYAGRHIAMIDVDDLDNYVFAGMWLQENGISWATVQSSKNNRYWMFLSPTFLLAKDALSLMDLCPRCDRGFLNFCNKIGYSAVRAFRDKNDDVPVVIQECKDKVVSGFINKLLKHYQSDEMQWLERQLQYNRGEVDIQNPDGCKAQNMSALDFMG